MLANRCGNLKQNVIMDAKLKAKELINKFLEIEDTQAKYGGNLMFLNEAKICCLLLIDENVKMLKTTLDESTEIYQSLSTPKKLCVDLLNPLLKFWNEVKEEVVSFEND